MRKQKSAMRGPTVAALGVLLTAPTPVEGSAGTDETSSVAMAEAGRERPLRALSPDRPDGTESPVTVDRGRVQVEMSFVDIVRDRVGDDLTRRLTLMDSNLKAGLAHNFDLQLICGLHVQQDTTTAAGQTRSRGVGDLQVRGKLNVWGNDGGATALGVMPFVKIPLPTEVSGDHVEGGLITMFAIDLVATWGLGTQVELDVVFDEPEDRYGGLVGHTVVVGGSVVGPLGIYLEYIGWAPVRLGDDYQAIGSGGLTYGVGPDLQFDVGSQVGLSAAADDLKLFAGVTTRR